MDDPRDLPERIADCLQRLDLDLLRLIGRDGDDPDWFDEAHLDDGTAELLALAEALAAAEDPDLGQGDLDAAVDACVRGLVQEVGFPLVLRTALHGRIPPVAGRRAELAHALQRALLLGARHAGSGGEVEVRTRRTDDGAEVEIRCQGAPDPHLRERALTLRAFVACMRGRCHVTTPPDGALQLVLELPLAVEADLGPS
ncbi:MAG: hypothetical protein AB7O97_11730 [Planctomycetota bacterium]